MGEVPIRDAQQLFSAIVAPVAVIQVGAAARVLFANEAARRLSFVLDDRPPTALDDDGEPLAAAQLPRARAGRGETFHGLVCWWETSDGQRCVVADGVPLAASALGEAAVVLSLNDVTDAREATRRCEESHRARDEFMAIAAHELRSPLSTLQLMVERLERTARRGEPTVLDELPLRLQTMRRQTDRLHVLVQNLMDLGRAPGRGVHLDADEFDLCDLVLDMAERWIEPARQAGSQLVVKTSEPVVGAWDRLRLEHVLNNLMSNAVKFGRGRPIQVTVQNDPLHGTVRLLVDDHGPGVAEGDRDRIFQRFHRDPTGRRGHGLGLGLYLVREIVRAHHGQVRCEPRAGGGSRFVVELPVQAARTDEDSAHVTDGTIS